ncbi:MAG: hypothetical protein ACXW4Q_03890 [Anaerolineales bacterium]
MNAQLILSFMIAILFAVFFNEIKRPGTTFNLKPNALRTVSWNG